jgi:1-phosphofructokinase family hexose kinase
MRVPIVTVTLNPAVDEAVSVDEFVHGAVNRCRLDALDAGGKGINASRVMHRLGRETIALGFVGGVTGAMVRQRLDEDGVAHAFDNVDELTRLNVMLYERRTGLRTRLYLPGANVAPERLAHLRKRLALTPPGAVVVLGGSIPPGLPSSTYRDFVAWLKSRGVLTIVDTSGAALVDVLAARPTLIKPNEEEAAEIVGFPVVSDADALQAARELQRRGAENVVVSQGAAGAVGLNGTDSFKAIPPTVTAKSTVGSGDSMVAGLAIAFAEQSGLEEGLRLGTAAGAGTAMLEGTHLCRLEDFKRLRAFVEIRRSIESGVASRLEISS